MFIMFNSISIHYLDPRNMKAKLRWSMNLIISILSTNLPLLMIAPHFDPAGPRPENHFTQQSLTETHPSSPPLSPYDC